MCSSTFNCKSGVVVSMAVMLLHIIFSVPIAVQKYYRFVPAWRCNEHEVKHICRYHSRQAGEKEFKSSKEEKNASAGESSRARTCHQCTRKASKDIYIEVSPGTYSITATSEDMVKQTHVVDISAGQSIDLTFVL